MTVALNGPQSLSTTTTVGGEYRFDGIPAGRWEIAASYSASPHAGISAYDAAFALQAAAQMRSFRPAQTLACDVDGDGTLTPDDASHLLQYRVGIANGLPVGDRCATTMLFRPVPAAHAGQLVVPPQVGALVCEPGRIVLDGLAAWAIAQDFDAVLLGDCTGNWVQP